MLTCATNVYFYTHSKDIEIGTTFLFFSSFPHSGVRGGATSWKVAGSIPECVIGIFHWHNPSSCTMAMELTQPLTEMSTRNISWG